MIFKIKIILILIFITYSNINVFAQNQPVRAYIDTNNILIGDQINLSISVNASKLQKVMFPVMPDSIGKVIFISQTKTDTLFSDNNVKYIKKFVITSFDSGEFVLNGFPVIITNQKLESDTFLTNNIYLKFRTVRVDTSQAFKDIKPIIEVPLSFWDFFPYILGLILIAVLIYIVLLIRKKYKKKEVVVKDYDPDIPPNLIALEGLRQLEAEKLWQKGLIKQYHSQLSEILRTYIERQFQIIALELTSIEIIHELQKKNMPSDTIFTLKSILDLADMVKFAKYNPLPDEHSTSMKNAFSFVEMTSYIIAPKEISEADKNV